MAIDIYEKRRPRSSRNQRKRRHPFLRFVALCLVLFFALYAGARLVAQSATDADGYVHVMLLGIDGESTHGRTDAMILASYNPQDGRLVLTSMLRDVMLTMGSYGRHKLNAAYKLGGANLVKSCVKYLFDVDVRYVVTVNYASFQALVDAVGGIEVDVTKSEAERVNRGMRSRRSALKDFSPLIELTEYGENTHLTGEQALAYCRIRKIDSDYARTSRQRVVLHAILQKLKRSKNPLTLINAAQTALSALHTDDMPLYAEIAIGGLAVLQSSSVRLYRLPADGTFESGTIGGVWQIRPDPEVCREMLRRYLSEP